MNQKSLFYEKQKFNQKWLWTIIILANTMGIYAFYQEYKKGNFVLEFFISHFIFTATFILFFYFMSLETTVTREAIAVKYFPFHLKKRIYPFAEIKQLEVIKYNPIRDFGGWGVRLSSNGKAFNVRGDYGLKLYFANRRQLIIGTQKPEELKKILEPLFKTT